MPSKPRRALIVAVGLLGGLAGGFLLAQLLAAMRGRIRDPRELEEQIGIHVSATVPVANEQTAIDQRKGKRAGAPFLLARAQPMSGAVEALRTLRLNLQLSLAETRGGRTILFTSAVPGQGKSFVSANLAYLIANAGPRVLLIDADLRLSSIGRDVAVGGSKGLSDVLREGLDPSALVKTDPTMNLSVLPAGAAPDNPGELLTTERLEPVFAWSASRYDIVIVDAPPILPVSNAVLLGAFADVTAFVRIDESARTCTRDGSLSNPTTRGTCAPSASRLGFTLASLAPIDSQCTHRCHSSARAKASSSSAISDRQPSAATSRKRSR
jgi:tyrosine-protein kinase Etk/Wzc